MNRRALVKWGIAVLVVALLVGAAYYIGLNRGQLPWPPGLGPGAEGTTSTTANDSPASQPYADLLAKPNEPAYVPGKGFAPDAQRILEIVSLQVSLEKHRMAKGVYPRALADLFPTFAPKVDGNPLTRPPVDPVSKQSYDYQLSADSEDYRLTAVLDNGKQYSVSKANLPR
ncbi:MAG: hypothetical protein HYX94_01550 [Chloroflexi bacterium]|nr:hypothetical protein [Chloroflexota bacterium]